MVLAERDFEALHNSTANARNECAQQCLSARTYITEGPEGTHDQIFCKNLDCLITECRYQHCQSSAPVTYAAWLLVLYSAFNSNSPLEGPRVLCTAILSRIFFMDSTDCLVSALSSAIFQEGCKSSSKLSARGTMH